MGKYRQVERIFEEHNFDYVYHLAAEFGRWNGEDYYENLWLTNAVGTKNIIRIQKKRFRMIFFGSAEVYGVMSEDVMDKVPIKQMNDYAIAKWVNELQITNSAAMYGTEAVRVKLFNVYGPGEHHSLSRFHTQITGGRTKIRSFHHFSDGWRHLKFMLIHAPTYLFTYPGLAFLFTGLFLMFSAFLNIRNGFAFGKHSMIAGSLLTIVDYQIFFGFFANIYEKRLPKFFTLEKGATIGAAMCTLGIIYILSLLLR